MSRARARFSRERSCRTGALRLKQRKLLRRKREIGCIVLEPGRTLEAVRLCFAGVWIDGGLAGTLIKPILEDQTFSFEGLFTAPLHEIRTDGIFAFRRRAIFAFPIGCTEVVAKK